MTQVQASPEPERPAGRPPRGLVETITANCRPQPAIPAVLVLLMSIIMPVLSQDPNTVPDQGQASMFMLLVPAGILASCGLAIAAGFCSLFPQAIWIVIAAWAMKFTAPGGPLPGYNAWVLTAGMIAAAAMIGFQLWRVSRGKFVPTIHDQPEDFE